MDAPAQDLPPPVQDNAPPPPAQTAPAPSDFQTRIGKLQQAGFNDQEVKDWTVKKGGQLLSAGFSQDEVNNYVGIKQPDMSGVQQMARDNLAKQNAVETPAEGEKAAEPKPPPTFAQNLDAGMGMPVSSMIGSENEIPASLSPDVRKHLMNCYAKNTANDFGDFMQCALPHVAEAASQGHTFGELASGIANKASLSLYRQYQALGLAAANMSGNKEQAEYAKSNIREANAAEGAVTPEIHSAVGKLAFETASGFAAAVPALLTAEINPISSLAAFSAQGGLEEYGQVGARGGTPKQAALAGAATAAINAAGAILPMKYFTEALGKVGFGEFMRHMVGSAVPSMAAMGIANSAVDTAIANPNKTWGDWLKEQPAGIAQSVASAFLFSGAAGARNAAHPGMQEIVGNKLGKPAAAITPEDISQTVGKSFKSKAPAAQEFLDHALIMFGPQKEAAAAQTLRDVYRDTGVPPAQVAEDAKVVPEVAQAVEAGKVPEIYESLKEPPPVPELDKPPEGLDDKPFKIDHDLHLPEDFREFSKGYEPTEKGINEAMRDYLLRQWRGTGNEHMLVQDNSSGTVLFSHTSGHDRHVTPSTEITKELYNPNNNLAVHHNHPHETPLSPGDIASLAHPGERSITAHAENASFSHASLTDEFRNFIKGASRTENYKKILSLAREATEVGKADLVPLFKSKELPKALVNKAVPELANIALAKNGVIDYTTSHDISGIPEAIRKPLEDKINSAMAEKLKEYGFDSGGKSGRISNPDEGTFGRDFGQPEEGASSGAGGASTVGDRESPEGNAGSAEPVEAAALKTEPPKNLSPEHREFEALLGTPENMNTSQLGKVLSKIEKIFSDAGDDSLPKGSELNDDQFSALEDYARRAEDAQSKYSEQQAINKFESDLSQKGAIDLRAFDLSPETKEYVDDVKRDILNFATPMETGSNRARAAAKDFANKMRLSQWFSNHLFNKLTDGYTPEQLTKMWNAMDEASVYVQTEENNGVPRTQAMADAKIKGIGHFGLPEDQQVLLQSMSDWAQRAWDAAKSLGMVEGEGLPFWTPRMAAVVGEDGKWQSPSQTEGQPPSLEPIGRNLKTTSPHLKGRKYLTAEETESAMQKLFGEEHGEDNVSLVRDIRTMPMALGRLEQAVAGRGLINEIKRMSADTGAETVRDTPADGYFTIDHPAFQTYKPKLAMDENGKWQQVNDENGKPLFDKVPIYVSKEFEGPLRAVLSRDSGAVYNAMMAIKGKAMGMIMYSPLIHNAVEFGRALPTMPGKILTGKAYFEGNRAKKDPAQMQEAITAGLVPIGARFFNQDISSVMESPDLTPGRSWTAKLLGGLTEATAGEKAGNAVKSAIDKFGDFWHNTLLWDRVGDLQMGLYVNMRDDLVKQGMDPKGAQSAAAHIANRFAGALPTESMGNTARKMANVALFSRSFTVGNLGVMKDMIAGLPSDVKSQLERDIGAEGAKAASDKTRRIAMGAFAMDIALMHAGNSILQDALDKLMRDTTLGQIGQGYVDRWNKLMSDHSKTPWDLLNLPADLQALSSTSSNEPGKQDRIHYSDDPKTGTAYYMRMPIGKIGEEFEGWLTSPLEMLRKKQGTLVAPLIDIYKNEDYFGHPIYDKDARGISGAAANIGKAVSHIMEGQIPEESIKGAYKILTGHADKLDVMKAVGPLVGLTFSKGYPGGPEAGILAGATRRHEAEISSALPKIKDAVDGGDTQQAKKIMSDLGMDARSQRSLLRHYENPAGKVNPRSMKKFEKIATPEEKEQMRRQQEE